MYAFQFQDGSWRIDFITNSRSPRPRPGTEAYDLYDASYLSRRDANAAIEKIRALASEQRSPETTMRDQDPTEDDAGRWLHRYSNPSLCGSCKGTGLAHVWNAGCELVADETNRACASCKGSGWPRGSIS